MTARTAGLSKWQYALLIGAPIAIGAGYIYYRHRKSNKSKSDKDGDESSLSVNETESSRDDPISQAMTNKNKGNKYFKAGKFSEAIKCYTEAITLCPEENKNELSTFYQNRAAAYENLKNFLQVIQDTTKAYELNSKYTKALYRRAKAYEQIKDFDKSLEDVTAVCILEGFQNQPALMMTDRVLKQLGQQHAKEAIKNHVPYLPSNHFITNYFISYYKDPFAGDAEKFQEGTTGYLNAVHSFKERRYADIISDCTQEINAESDDNLDHKMKALLLRATFYLLQGQMEPARTDLVSILGHTDINKEISCNALIKQATIKVQDEDLEGCLVDFNQAINLDPDNPDTYLHRGQIYLLMNKIDDSVKDLMKAVKIAPEFAIAHVQLTYMKYRQATQNSTMSEIKTVMDEFENLKQQFPKCSEAFFLYAQVLAEQQSYDKAEKLYDEALKIDPGNPNIYIHKGILLLQWKQNVDEAVKMINKGLQVDDKSEFGYETLGSIEVQRGNMERAIELFEKAIKLAKTENELVHLFSLKDAAAVQQKIARRLGINIPVLGST